MADFIPGQKVSAPGLFREGEVASLPNSKGECQVRVGVMTIWVAVDRLQPYKLTKKDKKGKGRSGAKNQASSGSTGGGGSVKIDLHGRTVKEAEEALVSTLDSAIMNGVSVIEVVHGLGSGKLKSLVHRFAATHSSQIAELREDMANPGRCLLYL